MSRPPRCAWPSVWLPQLVRRHHISCSYYHTVFFERAQKPQLQCLRRPGGASSVVRLWPWKTLWKRRLGRQQLRMGYSVRKWAMLLILLRGGQELNPRTGTWAAYWTSSAWHDSVRSCAAPPAGCVEAPVGDGGREQIGMAKPCLLTILYGPSLLFLRSFGVLPEGSLRPAWTQARRLASLSVSVVPSKAP